MYFNDIFGHNSCERAPSVVSSAAVQCDLISVKNDITNASQRGRGMDLAAAIKSYISRPNAHQGLLHLAAVPPDWAENPLRCATSTSLSSLRIKLMSTLIIFFQDSLPSFFFASQVRRRGGEEMFHRQRGKVRRRLPSKLEERNARRSWARGSPSQETLRLLQGIMSIGYEQRTLMHKIRGQNNQ